MPRTPALLLFLALLLPAAEVSSGCLKLPFSWRDVEGLPDLARLRLVLETLPDGEIVAAPEAVCGRGRRPSR